MIMIWSQSQIVFSPLSYENNFMKCRRFHAHDSLRFNYFFCPKWRKCDVFLLWTYRPGRLRRAIARAPPHAPWTTKVRVSTRVSFTFRAWNHAPQKSSDKQSQSCQTIASTAGNPVNIHVIQLQRISDKIRAMLRDRSRKKHAGYLRRYSRENP